MPAYKWMVSSLQVRIANVLAWDEGYTMSPQDCLFAAREMFGEGEFSTKQDSENELRFVPDEGLDLVFSRCPDLDPHILTRPFLFKQAKVDPRRQHLPFDEKVGRECDRPDCDAVAAECGHQQIVEALEVVGDNPFDLTAEERAKLAQAQTSKRMHKLEDGPWGFTCTACGESVEKDEDWKPWSDLPKVGGCPGAKVEDAVDLPHGHVMDPLGELGLFVEDPEAPPGVAYAVDEKGKVVGSVFNIATPDPTPSEPPEAGPHSHADVEGGVDSPASTPAATSADPVTPGSPPGSENVARDPVRTLREWDEHKVREGSFVPYVPPKDTDTQSEEATPGPQQEGDAPSADGGDNETSGPEIPEGMVRCERPECGEVVKPSATIVDEHGVRRCGHCHRAVQMGIGRPDLFCQEHLPKEGTGRFRLGDCPGCKSGAGEQPGGDRSGDHGGDQRGGAEAAPEVKTKAHPANPLAETKAKREAAEGIPADVICGACGHRGMDHDYKSRKCARCQLCDGFVARVELPDVDPTRPSKADLPVRWEVSCPVCGSNRTTAQDPTDQHCRDCAFSTPLMRICGEPAPAFDWARFLSRWGQEVEAPTAGMCRVSGKPIEPGEQVRMCTRAPRSIALTSAIADAIGYAGVLLREGRVVEVPLNEAAAEAGQAKPEMCGCCGEDIEPGTPGYEHGGVYAHFVCVDGEAAQPPVRESDPRRPCEWNPEKGRPTEVGDPFHGAATLSVGTGKNNIHLCASCRKLKPHSRLRKEVPLRDSVAPG